MELYFLMCSDRLFFMADIYKQVTSHEAVMDPWLQL